MIFRIVYEKQRLRMVESSISLKAAIAYFVDFKEMQANEIGGFQPRPLSNRAVTGDEFFPVMVIDMSGQLLDFKVGEPAMVMAINVEETQRLRLESMGILPGVEISIIAKGIGPLIVAAGESRVMVEQDIARGIIVV